METKTNNQNLPNYHQEQSTNIAITSERWAHYDTVTQ
jgi:hypothetical protein